MGRALIELLLLGGLLFVGGYLVVLARTALAPGPGTPAIPATRWVAAHHSTEGVTLVVVQRLAGEHPARVVEERNVRRIPDDSPDYETQIVEAMAIALERAAVLNSVE